MVIFFIVIRALAGIHRRRSRSRSARSGREVYPALGAAHTAAIQARAGVEPAPGAAFMAGDGLRPFAGSPPPEARRRFRQLPSRSISLRPITEEHHEHHKALVSGAGSGVGHATASAWNALGKGR